MIEGYTEILSKVPTENSDTGIDGVYWNFRQRCLSILESLINDRRLCWYHFDRGYTEMTIKDSWVDWKFILKFPSKFRRYTENSEGILKFLIRVLKFLLMILGYTEMFYQCWRVYWLWLQGRRRRKIRYIWGILKFFSMRVGGAASVTCNADFQFPMP